MASWHGKKKINHDSPEILYRLFQELWARLIFRQAPSFKSELRR